MIMEIPNLTDIYTQQPITLKQTDTWSETQHIFDKESALAIIMALAAERPLLIRGKPGTGKSQLARAAAHVLNRAFVSEVMHSKSESQDLLWHFDAISRLGDAQALSATAKDKTDEQIKAQLDPLKYLSPGALWWSLNWEKAKDHVPECNHNSHIPETPKDWEPEKGVVLLIDEIDKADTDLPNGLLESLGNHSFNVPWLDCPISIDENMPKPLVIITTNEEKELPGAFLRRCLVLNLELPKEEQALKDWLVARGEIHFNENDCAKTTRQKVAEQLWIDREEAARQDVTLPGQAEYLDILRALVNMAKGDTVKQDKLLKDISGFALKKFPRD